MIELKDKLSLRKPVANPNKFDISCLILFKFALRLFIHFESDNRIVVQSYNFKRQGLCRANCFTCELIAIRTALDIYRTWTNIANSDGIIALLDCRSAFEAIKEGKMGLIQEINSLPISIDALGKPCTLQWIPVHVDIEGNEMPPILLPMKLELLSL
ncbi:RNase H domain-containing protein [Trichonephila clavipes]|nr:RNase H domain-containing protein [Trichonephila clavipes]